MTNKIIQFVVIAMVSIAVISCGSSKKEKEYQNKIAELEQELAQNQPKTNSTSSEPEVKPEGPLPSFAFSEENHDFGTITEGDVVEHIFTFKNTGDAPLIISKAQGSCGCTVPDWPKQPIGIGEEGQIKVKFNSSKKPGIQNKTVTITANTYPKITKLRIKANVTKKEESPS